MKPKNTVILYWIFCIQNSVRLLLFELLASMMFCGTGIAQPHYREELGNMPVINMHTHPLHTLGNALTTEALDNELKLRIAAMDESGIRKSVLLCMGFETNKAPNLSHMGSEREAFYFLKAAPERFVVFTTVDFSQMNSPEFT